MASSSVEKFFQDAMKDYKSTAKNVYKAHAGSFYDVGDPLFNCGDKFAFNRKTKKHLQKIILNCEKKRDVEDHDLRCKLNVVNRLKKKLEEKKLADSTRSS